MKTPDEILEHSGISAAVRTARAEAWRAGAEAMRKACLDLTRNPYSDAIASFGYDEPLKVAGKIWTAIENMPIPEPPQEPADG